MTIEFSATTIIFERTTLPSIDLPLATTYNPITSGLKGGVSLTLKLTAKKAMGTSNKVSRLVKDLVLASGIHSAFDIRGSMRETTAVFASSINGKWKGSYKIY
jgi:hypothetical protein